MNNSFALILNNPKDFNVLLLNSSKYFGFEFKSHSASNASAIHSEKQFILDITPTKMHFLFPEEVIQEKFEAVIDLTKRFITENFQNQIIGIRYYDENNKDFINDLNGVKTLII